MERERQLQEPCIQGLPREAKTGLVARSREPRRRTTRRDERAARRDV